MKTVHFFSGFFLLLILTLAGPAATLAATLNVPGTYPFIQAGIDAAQPGDVVLVADGVYTGAGNKNLDFKGKVITVRSENGAARTIIDCEGSGRGFYFHSGEVPYSVLDGFTLRNGSSPALRGGGGMYFQGSSPTISNCTISGNKGDSHGGGVYCNEASPSFTNCTIRGNQATGPGGGVGCWEASPSFTNCSISGNIAKTFGGGIYCGQNAEASFTSCTITGNQANTSGGGIFSTASVTITDCTISGNSASNNGGGMDFEGHGFPKVSQCLISDNRADYGGGLFCGEASPTITRCIFSSNWSRTEGGGAIFFGGGSPIITNCLFSANVSLKNGGGMSIANGAPAITYCTITSNVALDSGGGISWTGGEAAPPVVNSIIWGNRTYSGKNSEIYFTAHHDIVYSDIRGGYPGEGNIDADPLFVEPATGNYHLLPGSPCIDSGTAVLDTDIDGEARPLGSGFDMGADEFSGGHAAFSGTPRKGIAPLEVSFTDKSFAEVTSWSWDFGDGNTSEEQNPVHTYTVPGKYTVRLTVAGPEGTFSTTYWDYITVNGILHVPADYPFIQAAIDAASAGDLVLVAPGVYAGPGNKNLDFKGKVITVRSESGPGNTIIDCEYSGNGFFFRKGEGPDSVVEGFTIRNGLSWYGGGIYATSASPTIRGCAIRGNFGIFGGGINGVGSNLTIENCTLSGNTAGVGGGILGSSSTLTVRNCTVSGNYAAVGGGIVGNRSSLTLANSILWGDRDQVGVGEVHVTGTPSSGIVTYSDIEGGYAGEGNINADPLFVDSRSALGAPIAEGDYHLLPGSPCIDAGTADGAPATDIDGDARPAGGGIDMGSDEVAASVSE